MEPTTPQPPTQPPVPQAKPDLAPPENNIKNKFSEIKSRAVTKIGPWYSNLSPANKRLVTIMGVLLLIVGVLFVLALFFAPRRGPAAPTPTPVATSAPTATPAEITNPSRYATDSGVLKIETDLKDIEAKLNQTKLKDSDLTPPSLDYNIDFSK